MKYTALYGHFEECPNYQVGDKIYPGKDGKFGSRLGSRLRLDDNVYF